MLPRECLGFSNPFFLGNERFPGFSSNHHRRKGLCLKGRSPQEFIPWWVTEEGQLPPGVAEPLRGGRTIAGTRKGQAVVVADMLWDPGQVHHRCVQGTKFLVFLWKNLSSCYNFLIICPCGPVHHQEELAPEISNSKMQSMKPPKGSIITTITWDKSSDELGKSLLRNPLVHICVNKSNHKERPSTQLLDLREQKKPDSENHLG